MPLGWPACPFGITAEMLPPPINLDELADDRLDICESCPRRSVVRLPIRGDVWFCGPAPAGVRDGKCKCGDSLQARARLPGAMCPLSLWEKTA